MPRSVKTDYRSNQPILVLDAGTGPGRIPVKTKLVRLDIKQIPVMKIPEIRQISLTYSWELENSKPVQTQLR
jgi:hypothetical protein